MIVMVDVNSLVETFSWHVLQIERSFSCCKVFKRHAVQNSQSGKKAWHLRIAGTLHFKVRQCFKKVHQWACQRLNWSTMQMLKEVLLQRQKKKQLRLFQLIFILRIDEMRSTFSIGSVKHANKIPLQSYLIAI